MKKSARPMKRFEMAWRLTEQGKPKKAIALLERANCWKKDPLALFTLANLYVDIGQLKKGFDYNERAYLINKGREMKKYGAFGIKQTKTVQTKAQLAALKRYAAKKLGKPVNNRSAQSIINELLA